MFILAVLVCIVFFFYILVTKQIQFCLYLGQN